MKSILVFLADGFEEIEALTPVDMCRRAGMDVKTVSIKDSLDILSSHSIPVKADILLDDADADIDAADMLVLPGGGLGTENLKKCDKLLEILKEADKKEMYLSAICAAPSILGELGLLNGRRACCFPGKEDSLKGAEYVPGAKVVKDGRFITARGMGASVDFGAAIITQLLGSEKTEEILRQIQYHI